MKKLLCEAFCNSIRVRKVPIGYAVSTSYQSADGDPLLFYVIRSPTSPEKWRLEDDGTQISFIAASGVNLKKGTRHDALNALLDEYHLTWNQDTQTVRSDEVSEEHVGESAVRFIAFLLRLQDLVLLDPQTVASTFRQDALDKIHGFFDRRAIVAENETISGTSSAFSADVVIKHRRNEFAAPLALYIATTEEKGLQALVLKMESEKYQMLSSKVVLLVEHSKRNPLRDQTYALAQARLDSVLSFRGVEQEAMMKLNELLYRNDLTKQ